MRNLINDQNAKPTPKSRVSVLFIVSVAILLVIIGVSSWSYFHKPAQPETPLATASIEIGATVEAQTEQTEVLQEPEPNEPRAKTTYTIEQTAPREEAPPPALATTPEPKTTAPPADPESIEEKQTVTERATTLNESAQEPDGSPSMSPETPVQENLEIPPEPLLESTTPAQTEQNDESSVFKELSASAIPPDRTEATPVIEETAKEPPAVADEMDAEVAVEPEAVPEGTLPRKAPTEKPPKVTDIAPQADAVLEESVIEDTTPPFQEFAAPFDNPENRPRIAVVLSDAGMNAKRTRQAIEVLPAPVTFAFNPYGDNLQQFVDHARQAGHEVLLQLPMEPKGYPRIDPGPQALRTDLDEAENLRRFDWALERITGYVGLTNQMGSKFTAEAKFITPVLLAIKEKGLLYLDSRTASDSVAADIAMKLEIPVAINNRFLDHKADGDIIDKRLEELEKIARQSGSSVGIAYPHEETIQHLLDWANTLDKKGFALAPVSALIENRKLND